MNNNPKCHVRLKKDWKTGKDEGDYGRETDTRTTVDERDDGREKGDAAKIFYATDVSGDSLYTGDKGRRRS